MSSKKKKTVSVQLSGDYLKAVQEVTGSSGSYSSPFSSPVGRSVQLDQEYTDELRRTGLLRDDDIYRAKFDDIGPVRKRKKEEEEEEDDSLLDFFQKGAFSDGYQRGDVTRTILGTVGDAGLGIVKGLAGLGEGIGDAGKYLAAGVADAIGKDDWADRQRKAASVNLVEEYTKGATDYLDKYSILGRTSDAILQGIGQVGGIMATGGLAGAAGAGAAGATAATSGLMFASGFGSNTSEALRDGASIEDAQTYGLIAGASDAITELIFGGLGKAVKATGLSTGLSSADDMLAKKVSNMFTNQIAKNFAEFGIKAGAEGLEEVLAGVAQAAGKRFTYLQEAAEKGETNFWEILKDENLLEQFVVGSVTSGIIQSGIVPGTSEGSLIESNKESRDFITGQSQNEQTVIKKEIEKRIAEAEKDGKTLSKKEKSAIEYQVEQDMERGDISIDTIEEALGGDTYQQYREAVDKENEVLKEFAEMYQGDELKQQVNDFLSKSESKTIRERLAQEVSETVKGDRLVESYNERARRRQAFQADPSKYDAKQQAVIQKAVESKVLNNTRKTHEFVDFVAKMSADTGVSFDFTNNEKLKGSRYAVEGKTVNGYVDENGNVVLNSDSNASRKFLVGHEITHVLEGTDLYNTLQDTIFEYAKSKKSSDSKFANEYMERLYYTRQLYKDIEGYQGVEGFQKIKREVVADLVGEYVFSDTNFVNNLSTNNRNVFQKIYDEIKHMLKLATAGSKEAKELERVKKAFDDAYRARGKETTTDASTKTETKQEATVEDWRDYAEAAAEPKTDFERYDRVYYQTNANLRESARHFAEKEFKHDVDSGMTSEELRQKAQNLTEEYNELQASKPNMTDFTEAEQIKLSVLQYQARLYRQAGTDAKKDVKYSLSSDSDGRKLSKEQQEYFKDSKAVDEDGNLKVMYHGTSKGGFSLFNTYGSNYGLFGVGSYFTDSKTIAESYTNKGKGKNKQVYETYLNIKNPMDMDGPANAAEWAEAFPDADLPESGTNEEFYRAVEEFYADQWMSKWEVAEEIQAGIESGMGYDGITHIGGGRVNADGERHRVFIAFQPEQIKNVDNTNPTDHPDIRYSVSDSKGINKKLKDIDIQYDADNETVSYSLNSLDDAFSYNESEADYLAAREEYANAIAKATGKTYEEADRYIDNLFLIREMIANDRDRLDYEAAVDKSAWVSNAEYGGSIDFSTLCAKRRLFTGTFDAIQNALPDTVLNENDFLHIRNMLLEKKLESPCSMCYVEGSRAKHGVYVNKWLKEYLKTDPEWKPQIADFTSTTRLEQTRINHPEAYAAYKKAMNKLSQRKPKEASVRTDYKGEILRDFKDTTTVAEKNTNGGVRFNSFSDFEIIHALDAMQVITDMSRVGLNGQAYTKVKEFAEAFGNTGLKINLSLVAKDVDADGKLILDETNGMKYAEAMDIRNRYSDNVGTVIVVFNEAQLKAALADSTIDYVLPFHRSQWKKSQYTMMGLPTQTKDFTNFQNDRYKNPKTGRPKKAPDGNIMPNEYWDFNLSGRENAQKYLDYINESNYIPKFDFLLEKDADGDWMLPEGPVGDGYFKLLIDFKMYNNEGVGSPQNPVLPEFNMPYIQQMLSDYTGGHQAFPVAHDVVDEFVKGKKGGKFSVSDASQQGRPVADPMSQLRYEGDPIQAPVQEAAPVQQEVPAQAPVQAEEPVEEVAPVAENATIDVETTPVEDILPDNLKPVQEELTTLLQEKEELENRLYALTEAGDFGDEFNSLSAEWSARNNRINELEEEIEDAEAERLRSFNDADAPAEAAEADVSPDRIPLTKKVVADISRDVRSMLGLSNKDMADVRSMIEEYNASETPDREELVEKIRERFGQYTEEYVDEDLRDAKQFLRTYPIHVSDSIKGEIADYRQLMRSNFGKMRFSKNGVDVDVAYRELHENYPGLFPESIYVPTDQLERIIEVANADPVIRQQVDIDAESIERVADAIINGIGSFRQTHRAKAAGQESSAAFSGLMADADQHVPPVTEDIAPVAPTQAADIAPAVSHVAAESVDDIAPTFDVTGKKDVPDGQQAFMEDAGVPKKMTRKERHEAMVDNIKTVFREKGFDFDNVLKKARNLSTFSTVDNTPQRVMEKALGYKEGQVLADLTVNKVAQNETESIKWLNSFTNKKHGLLAQISKEYGIRPGSKKSAAAQMYAEGFYVDDNQNIVAYGDRELAIDFPDPKVRNNIKRLARDPRIRKIYDDTLASINESRVRNGYPEIPKLDNYFLHFRAMDDTFSKIGLPFNPNDIRAKDLPTDLNGVTADLKPGQPYFASAMHRKGKRTSFDMLGGLERYLTSAKNQIYHIDDIQTLRALRDYIANTYGQAHGLENLDTMNVQEAEERIEEVFDSHLSTFAKFLNEEANVLAGKTALIDRGVEGIIGRRGITFLNTLNKQVGANMVGFNISSSLTNFLAVSQAMAKTNKFDFVKGFTQTAANKITSIFGKNDGFVDSSPVMLRRKGADSFYRTPYQKVGDMGYVFMSIVDEISTELIARTKYNELTRKGMDSQQAHFETDKWVSRLMGDRSLGQQPQLYNSKMLGVLTKFQLEVRNQLDSQFYDTIQDAKVSSEHIQNGLLRNAKKAAKITSTFAQLAVLQHLFGVAFESVAGYNPAFDIIEVLTKTFGWDDEEDDEDTWLDNIEEGFMELLGDMPYSSILTGGRIPLSSALPITEFVKGEDQYGNEKSRWETLGEVAPYYILPGGYGQIKKTTAGLEMFNEDHPIAGSYTDSGNLRFPIEDTPLNKAQAAVFGQYANDLARDYFNNERKSLKENEIEELVDTGMPIRDYWQYRDDLGKIEKWYDKADYIARLDLPLETRNILINNISDREDPIDLTGYENYPNYEEFDWAKKYPEKYAFLNERGITAREYKDMDDDSKSAYSWAVNNPEAYTVSRAVMDDVVKYREITMAMWDIKADKDENGKSINGTRKTKIYDYVYGLEIGDIEKHILFKNEYNSDDSHNMEIIDYLNGRDDLTAEDVTTILRYLDFKVDAEGYISW